MSARIGHFVFVCLTSVTVTMADDKVSALSPMSGLSPGVTNVRFVLFVRFGKPTLPRGNYELL